MLCHMLRCDFRVCEPHWAVTVCVTELLTSVYRPPSTFHSRNIFPSAFRELFLVCWYLTAVVLRSTDSVLTSTQVGFYVCACVWFDRIAFSTCQAKGLLSLGHRIRVCAWGTLLRIYWTRTNFYLPVTPVVVKLRLRRFCMYPLVEIELQRLR